MYIFNDKKDSIESIECPCHRGDNSLFLSLSFQKKNCNLRAAVKSKLLITISFGISFSCVVLASQMKRRSKINISNPHF